MAFDEIDVGAFVFDRWWPCEKTGRVIFKTRGHVVVQTPSGPIRYDKAHCQFLEPRK